MILINPYRFESIVLSNLSLHLDASNPSSYSGSGSIWYDLSGFGNHQTLANSVGYDSANGGSLVLNASNNYLYSSTSTVFSDFTVSVWVNITTPISSSAPSYNVYALFMGNSENNFLSITGGGAGIYYDRIAVSYNFNSNPGWHNIVYRYSGGVLKVTIDNSITGSITTANILNSSLTRIIGKRNYLDTTHKFLGKIGHFLTYNRALTDSEVEINFKATKSRFGL